jgi:hypothetical protein
MRYEIFRVMEIHAMDFWVMTPYSDVVGYKCFRGLHCLHLQRDSIVL